MEHTPLIGIVAPLLARNHIRNIVRGALSQLQACGCKGIVLSPLVHFSQCNAAHADAEMSIFRQIQSPAFDGFLYIKDETTLGTAAIAEIETQLIASNKFVMTVDEKEHSVFDSTQYDDYDDFRTVVRHLIEVHHYRRIYCLTGPAESFQAQSRLRAYQDVMQENGLFFDESYYCCGTFWVDSAKAFADRILSGELVRPEAIVCGNDVTAMALIRTLQAGGIRVPEDVAVTGYDGYPFSANISVSLTTYTRNHYQLGADAVRRLYRNLTGKLCQKIRRPEGGFLIGNSCGCESIPAKQMLHGQSTALPRMWEEEMFFDDMPFDLAAARDIPALLQSALRHVRILYELQALRIYLTEPDGTLRCAAAYPALTPEMQMPFAAEEAEHFLQAQDAAVFLSPLHMQEKPFGMIALSFGRSDRIYDRYYLDFVGHLEIALERFSALSDADAPESTPARSHRQQEVYDTLLSLRKQIAANAGEDWTVEQMCRITDMSRSTLQKHYKACFGCSISSDLIRFRIELAKRLLRETELSLGEISLECGYSTESYFMKQFKSVTHMTPTSYRMQKGPRRR